MALLLGADDRMRSAAFASMDVGAMCRVLLTPVPDAEPCIGVAVTKRRASTSVTR
jgi:hypothetical protein